MQRGARGVGTGVQILKHFPQFTIANFKNRLTTKKCATRGRTGATANPTHCLAESHPSAALSGCPRAAFSGLLVCVPCGFWSAYPAVSFQRTLRHVPCSFGLRTLQFRLAYPAARTLQFWSAYPVVRTRQTWSAYPAVLVYVPCGTYPAVLVRVPCGF